MNQIFLQVKVKKNVSGTKFMLHNQPSFKLEKYSCFRKIMHCKIYKLVDAAK